MEFFHSPLIIHKCMYFYKNAYNFPCHINLVDRILCGLNIPVLNRQQSGRREEYRNKMLD